MHDEWLDFLARQGARLVDGVVREFEPEPGRDDDAPAQLVDLSHLSVIRVLGADARRFLHSQLTNDIEQLGNERACYAAYCTAKGRVIVTALAWCDERGCALVVDRGLASVTVQQLRKYVLRTKVSLEDGSQDSVILGLLGGGARERLRQHLDALPDLDLGLKHSAGCTLIQRGADRFQLITTTERARELWSALKQHARPAATDAWERAEIRAGIAHITPVTSEQFTPQMINFDLIGGVSFDKGCFPGQEIVARTHYLGQAKRRLVHAHLGDASAGPLPLPGAELYATHAPAQPCGMIVNSARGARGGYDLLAVVHSELPPNALVALKGASVALQFDHQPA